MRHRQEALPMIVLSMIAASHLDVCRISKIHVISVQTFYLSLSLCLARALFPSWNKSFK